MKHIEQIICKAQVNNWSYDH